jgi:hypothetical protein
MKITTFCLFTFVSIFSFSAEVLISIERPNKVKKEEIVLQLPSPSQGLKGKNFKILSSTYDCGAVLGSKYIDLRCWNKSTGDLINTTLYCNEDYRSDLPHLFSIQEKLTKKYINFLKENNPQFKEILNYPRETRDLVLKQYYWTHSFQMDCNPRKKTFLETMLDRKGG